MMAEGQLSFKLDKQGELMAILQNGKSQIKKQVRLEEIQLDPSTAQSVSNLTTTAMLNQVLDEIEAVREAIGEIHVELQDDRLALAEAAKDRLIQASKVVDTSLRANALLSAICDATNAKHQLMRNFGHNRISLDAEAGKSVGTMMFEKLGKNSNLKLKADDAMEDLSLIAATVQVECIGWEMLGEQSAARHCLSEFRTFIQTNKLDDEDTLLMINEHSPRDWTKLAEQVGKVSKQIEGVAMHSALPDPTRRSIKEGE